MSIQPPIVYRDSLQGIEPVHLEGFFDGWPKRPTSEQHLRILRNSTSIIIAWGEEQERVVGFVNAITDGEMMAFIPLLEVLPQYRSRGIGRELVRRMMHCLESYYSIDLVCDEEVAGFYEQLNLTPGRAMMHRNRRFPFERD